MAHSLESEVVTRGRHRRQKGDRVTTERDERGFRVISSLPFRLYDDISIDI